VLALVNDAFGATSRSLARSLTAAARDAQGWSWPGRRNCPFFDRTEKRGWSQTYSRTQPGPQCVERSLLLVAPAWDYVAPRIGLVRLRWPKVPHTLLRERDVLTEVRLRSLSRGGGPSRPESHEATARESQLERMVPVRPHGGNRVRTHVILTTPVARFLLPPDAAGHGRIVRQSGRERCLTLIVARHGRLDRTLRISSAHV